MNMKLITLFLQLYQIVPKTNNRVIENLSLLFVKKLFHIRYACHIINLMFKMV